MRRLYSIRKFRELIKKYNKLRYTKPKPVYVRRLNLIRGDRAKEVLKIMRKKADHPKISYTNVGRRTKKGLPVYNLLEGSHRSFVAKITGRPINLKLIDKRKVGSNLEINEFFWDLQERLKKGGYKQLFKPGEYGDTKPIKLLAVREKKHTKISKELLRKINRYLKASKDKQKKRWLKKIRIEDAYGGGRFF